MLNCFKEQFIARQLSNILSIHRYGAYSGAGGRAPPYQRSPLLANGATLDWRFRAPLQVGIHCDCFILGKILLTCKPKPPVARAESAQGYAAEGLTKGLARPRTKKKALANVLVTIGPSPTRSKKDDSRDLVDNRS
jgi:hypothetical protein